VCMTSIIGCGYNPTTSTASAWLYFGCDVLSGWRFVWPPAFKRDFNLWWRD
jgi:hypothetical protein